MKQGTLAIAAGVVFFGIVIIGLLTGRKPAETPQVPYRTYEQLTDYTAPYVSEQGITDPTSDIQCPVPMTDRVPNYTGIQCVWSSIELLGRWAEEPKLMNPPITSRSDCKSFSSPSLAATRLRQLNVKFEQAYQGRAEGIALIKKAMSEGRACLWSVPGHAMVIVHFDEANNVFKWVDNSDRSLKIQTGTMADFNRRWDGWVLVIYADVDIIPAKLGKASRTLPITNPENPGESFPPDFIPIPRPRSSSI